MNESVVETWAVSAPNPKSGCPCLADFARHGSRRVANDQRRTTNDRSVPSLEQKLRKLAPWNRQLRRATRNLSLIEYRVCSHVCWLGGQHLLFTVDQVAGVEGGNFEAVSVGDRIRGAGLDAVSAENTSIVIDVINLGVAFRATHAMLSRILRRLNINAVRWTGRSTEKTGDALFQSILIAL